MSCLLRSCPGTAFLLDSHVIRPHAGPLRVIPAPTFLVSAYRAMVETLPLARAPRLVMVASAGGAGGLFTPGAIVLGASDVRALVADMLANYREDLRRIVRPDLWRRTRDLTGILERIAAGRIVAHELGHALVRAGFATPFPHDEEAAADYLAGRIDAACGMRPRFGQVLFYAIGCVGSYCTHPSPLERLAAYARGHDDQLTAIAFGESAGGLDVQYAA